MEVYYTFFLNHSMNGYIIVMIVTLSFNFLLLYSSNSFLFLMFIRGFSSLFLRIYPGKVDILKYHKNKARFVKKLRIPEAQIKIRYSYKKNTVYLLGGSPPTNFLIYFVGIRKRFHWTSFIRIR